MGDREGGGGDIATLVDSSVAALWLIDAESLAVRFMSRGVEAIAGYPRDAWLEPGFFFLDAIPIAAAAPMTLIGFGVISLGLFAAIEQLESRWVKG